MTNTSKGEQGDRATRRDFLRGAGAAATAAFAASAFPGRRTPANANSRLGIGIIGCGSRGGGLTRTLLGLGDDGVEVVAVCDTYRPRMAAAAENSGAERQYMDHRELLDDPRVDAVIIATPDHVHGYQVIDAANKGKHIFCEKPFTHWRQFELTKQARNAVREAGVVFELGTQGMMDSSWRQARALVEQGLIGEPIHAECGYFRVGDWGERGMPVDDPDVEPGADLDWDAFLAGAPQRPFDVSRYFRWRLYEDYSGGPVTDLYPHSMTPAVYALGLGAPSHAVATGGIHRYDYPEREVPDTFNMIVEYPERVSVAVLGTQGNDYTATGSHSSLNRSPVLRGWEGSLIFDGDEVKFIPADGSDKEPRTVAVEDRGSGQQHMANFVSALRGESEPVSDIELAYNVQTALHMATLSYRRRITVQYDPERETLVDHGGALLEA